MVMFFLKRMGEALVTVWGVVTIVFFITRILGDPITLFVPIGATNAQIAALTHSYGLDLPLWKQYIHYVIDILHGNFGKSFIFGYSALQVVLQRLPATILLASTALFLGVLSGTIAGAVAALKKGGIAELTIMAVAVLAQATPTFWLGIMFILWFAVHLHWLPAGGYGTLSNLILPAATLGVFVFSSLARLLRSSILDILQEDYIRTARAKGLYPTTILCWHIARNALIPITTMVALLTGELLGGSVVTETVFGWPGIGRLTIQAIQASDFPVIQAAVFIDAALFVLINLSVDLLYQFLDPRIRSRG